MTTAMDDLSRNFDGFESMMNQVLGGLEDNRGGRNQPLALAVGAHGVAPAAAGVGSTPATTAAASTATLSDGSTASSSTLDEHIRP